MTKARILANFISDGNTFADEAITVTEVTGAAPIANPSFTGTVTSSGSVGIGTSSPAFPLDLSTNSSTTNDAVVVARISANTTGTAANNFGAALNFSGEDASGSLRDLATINAIYTNATNRSSALTFKTRENLGALTERMHISAAGNVGIGITSASKKLSVHASTAYDGALISNAHASSAARLQLNNDDSKSIQIDMGGSTQTTYGPYIANTAAIVANSAPLNIGTDSANHVAFYTNLTERMFISSTGKVGITNNSPTESLHIKGTNPRIYLEGDTNSYYPSVRVEGVNGGISLGTYYGGNISGKNSLTFLTGDSATDGGSPRLQIRSDNDIEIRNLQSAAGGNDTNALYWKIQNSANTGQYARLGGIKAETVSAWGGKLKFYTKPANGTPNDTVTEQMVIDQAGRVTMPYQPSFQAASSGGWSSNITQDTWYKLPFNSTAFNTGGHYSTSSYNFTAPVAGKYLFIFNVYAHHNNPGDNNDYFSVRYGVNGGTQNYHSINGYQNQGDDDTTTSQSAILSLAQNDTVQVFIRGHGTTVRYYGNNCYFFGQLLG